VRICVVGDGIAGTLLAWRLAATAQVCLVSGGAANNDATGASGGLVRAFETDPGNAAAALDGLVQLYADDDLRRMAGYRETGSVYLTGRAPARGLLADVEARLPGSVSVIGGAEAGARFGICGAPGDSHAIVEQRSGYLNPGRLRDRIRALLPQLGVELAPGPLARLAARGGLGYEADGRFRYADAIVLATGAWTPRLLSANGLKAAGLRTKAVEYTVFAVDGPVPPPFVDEHSGLYGRPAGPGRILLGLPSGRWDIEPPGWADAGQQQRVHETARTVLPGLRLLAAVRSGAAVDAYCADGRLRLRPVTGGIYTFTGGSGGAAKTALAASAAAARGLAQCGEEQL